MTTHWLLNAIINSPLVLLNYTQGCDSNTPMSAADQLACDTVWHGESIGVCFCEAEATTPVIVPSENPDCLV